MYTGSLSYGQESEEKTIGSNVISSLNIGVNLQSAFGSSISKVYSIGYGLEVGLELNVYSQRLFVIPLFSFDYFGSYVNDAIQNNLFNRKFGFSVKYEFSSSKFIYLPFLELCYGNAKNSLSSRSGYIGDLIDVLSGSGFSNGIGVGICIKPLNISLVYNYFKPTISVDNDISGLANQISDIYNPYTFHNTKLDLSTIKLTVSFIIK